MPGEKPFIANEPAMKVGTLLVIADLHLGITKDARDRGIHLPSQVVSLANRINVLKAATRTKKLVLLGDVRHRIPIASWQEEREIPLFFDRLDFRNVVVTKGNHDGGIERLVPSHVRIVPSYSHANYCFTHGHRNIGTSKKTIVIGHNQPHILFRDRMGAIYVEPVWVRGTLRSVYKTKSLVIMPAFNELAGATVVNKDELLGPIARRLDCDRAHCYLLDGTDLGTISSLAAKS